APGADDASGGFAATVAGVSNQDPRAGGPDEGPPGEASFAPLAEPGFVHTADQATSTFGVDVDRASYALTRRYLLEWKKRPPKNAVRLEELVNYFSYAYPEPPGGAAMAVSVDDAPAPWAPEHRLVRIGLQARRGETARLPASTLVFLVDVSGSMEAPDRLPLVKQALAFLAEELRPEDRLALVAYADRAWVVLPATAGDRKAEILDALDALEPGGGTAGASGLELAYQVAERARRPKDNARVVLATDGDFNVGASSPEELVSLIERHRARRIALSVLGVGSGADLQDARMEIIADRGDGNYAYADTVREARRALVEEMGGTLTTVARDVKIQVTFNPAQVQAWRLLGYENRALAREDFEDDSKDAGEMGAGHAVTALYEITPEVPGEPSVAVPEWMTVEVRWQPPQGGPSELLQVPAVLGKDTSSPDFRFASAVAEFALLLRDSPYKGQASLEAAIDRARAIVGDEPEGPRAELIALMEAYRTAP
ncbi:MAG TPA: von Willebrand factor type A domain-containing protein, partial [Candidatus Polarisedimenticolaceae bacterium]|nr:von Willebrand factor type A domain-containing protein [Candidatus Polarisedimenticolaceae bacterium]